MEALWFFHSFTHSYIHSFALGSQGHLCNLDSGGDCHVVSPCFQRTWDSKSARVPFLGPSAAGQVPTYPPAPRPAGVEEGMECKQAPRAEHTKRRPPDTRGIHVQAACGTVGSLRSVRLLWRSRARCNTRSLGSKRNTQPLLCSCLETPWTGWLREEGLDSVRAEEFPLGACSQRPPPRSIRRGCLSSPLSAGREPACTVGPKTHLFIRGVLCGLPHGAEDLAAPAGGFSPPCFSSLQHLSPQQPGPHTDSRKYNTGGPAWVSAVQRLQAGLSPAPDTWL